MSENLAASLNDVLPNAHNSQNTIRIRGARQHNLKNIDFHHNFIYMKKALKLN
jgi:excinuclease ABC subunit A